MLESTVSRVSDWVIELSDYWFAIMHGTDNNGTKRKGSSLYSTSASTGIQLVVAQRGKRRAKNRGSAATESEKTPAGKLNKNVLPPTCTCKPLTWAPKLTERHGKLNVSVISIIILMRAYKILIVVVKNAPLKSCL